jgi:hypothetical protein
MMTTTEQNGLVYFIAPISSFNGSAYSQNVVLAGTVLRSGEVLDWPVGRREISRLKFSNPFEWDDAINGWKSHHDMNVVSSDLFTWEDWQLGYTRSAHILAGVLSAVGTVIAATLVLCAGIIRTSNHYSISG